MTKEKEKNKLCNRLDKIDRRRHNTKMNNIKVQEGMEIKVEQWDHTEIDKIHDKVDSNFHHQDNKKFNRGKSFQHLGNRKFNQDKSFLLQDSSNPEIKEKKVSNQILLSNKELNSDIKLKKLAKQQLKKVKLGQKKEEHERETIPRSIQTSINLTPSNQHASRNKEPALRHTDRMMDYITISKMIA